MTDAKAPIEIAPTIDPAHAIEGQPDDEHGELQWLKTAASKIPNQDIAGQVVSERMGELVTTYRSTGEREQLVGEASGIVALVGLYHVENSALSAREVLEAVPQLVIDIADDDDIQAETFASRLADATEAFCVNARDKTSADPETKTDLEQYDLSPLNRLAARAKQGDAHATSQLIARSATFARLFITSKRYYMPGGDIEDLCQEGLIGVMRALRSYDPARGDFAPLAATAIRRGVWTGIKTATRDKHTPLNQALSLNRQASEESDEGGSTLLEIVPDPRGGIEDSVLDKEKIQAMQVVLEGMTELERTSILLLADGLTYEEITQTMKRSYSTVDNALQRARRKLANANL